MLSKSTIKCIQSLADKKARAEANCFIAEGPKIVEALIELNGVSVQHIYALPKWIDQHKNLLEKRKNRIQI